MVQLIALLVLLILVIFVLYKRYQPTIDLIKCDKGYSVLLWYNKYFDEENYDRTYIRLT